jgi:hypothetical protein
MAAGECSNPPLPNRPGQCRRKSNHPSAEVDGKYRNGKVDVRSILDLDVSGLLRYEYDLVKAGDMMMDVIYKTVNGLLAPLK